MLLKKKDAPEDNYDVIIIGAGLAGLTAANKLATCGRRVLLLEAHNKLGGLATWFKRKQGEYIFDVSLHGFPIGMKKTCRKYWSKEIADSIVQVKKVRFVNPQFNLETTFTKEDYSAILHDHFKIPTETVQQFFAELANMNFYDKSQMKNSELFDKYFPDRNDIVRFLLEPIVYANGSNLDDEAITYGIVFSNFMNKGVYIYQGGTDELIFKMQEILLNNGVDIKLHAKIDDIVIKNKQVQGVQLGQQMIHAPVVLSNANLLSTVFKLSGEKNFTPEFIQKCSKVRLNTSSAQVFMGLKNGCDIPFVGDLIFYSEDETFSSEQLLDTDSKSQTFSIYYPDMRPARDASYAIVSSMNARFEDWDGLTPEEYNEKKAVIIKKALAGIEKLIPGVGEKIDFIEASTPLTVKKYTHHEKGASFGTKFEGLDISMNLNKQVTGLFHAGSVGIIMSGWLGAANYGVIQAHNIDNHLDTL